MKHVLAAMCLVVLGLGAARSAAQVNPYKEGTPGVTGYRAEVMAEFLLKKNNPTPRPRPFPAGKYAWPPADDTRSFAEVFLHISAANYNLYSIVGTPPPSGIDVKNLEKS